MPLSANFEALAQALDPDAFVPHPDWHARHKRAVDRAVGLASSNDPNDHMIAALSLMFAPRKSR